MYYNCCCQAPQFWDCCQHYQQYYCCRPRRLPRLEKMTSFPKLEPVNKKKRKNRAKSKQTKAETKSSADAKKIETKSAEPCTNDTCPQFAIKAQQEKALRNIMPESSTTLPSQDLETESSQACTKKTCPHFVKKYQESISDALISECSGACTTETCPYFLKKYQGSASDNFITESSVATTNNSSRHRAAKQEDELTKKSKIESSNKCTNETCANIAKKCQEKMPKKHIYDSTEQSSNEITPRHVNKITNLKAVAQTLENPKTCTPTNCPRLRKKYADNRCEKQNTETTNTCPCYAKRTESSRDETQESQTPLDKKNVKSRSRNIDSENLESCMSASCIGLLKKYKRSDSRTDDSKKQKTCAPTNCPQLLKISEKTNNRVPKTADSSNYQDAANSRDQRATKKQNVTSAQTSLSNCSHCSLRLTEKERLQQRRNSVAQPSPRRRSITREARNGTSSYSTGDSDTQSRFGDVKAEKSHIFNARPKQPKNQTATYTEALSTQLKQEQQKLTTKKKSISESSVEQTSKLRKDVEGKVNRDRLTYEPYDTSSTSPLSDNKNNRSTSSRSSVRFHEDCKCETPKGKESTERAGDSSVEFFEAEEQQILEQERPPYTATKPTKEPNRSKRDPSALRKRTSEVSASRQDIEKNLSESWDQRKSIQARSSIIVYSPSKEPSPNRQKKCRCVSQKPQQRTIPESSTAEIEEMILARQRRPSKVDSSMHTVYSKDKSSKLSTAPYEDSNGAKLGSSDTATENEKSIRRKSLLARLRNSSRSRSSNKTSDQFKIYEVDEIIHSEVNLEFSEAAEIEEMVAAKQRRNSIVGNSMRAPFSREEEIVAANQRRYSIVGSSMRAPFSREEEMVAEKQRRNSIVGSSMRAPFSREEELVAAKQRRNSIVGSSMRAPFSTEESSNLNSEPYEDIYDTKLESSDAATENEKSIRTTSLLTRPQNNSRSRSPNKTSEQFKIYEVEDEPINALDMEIMHSEVNLDITSSIKRITIHKRDEKTKRLQEKQRWISGDILGKADKNVQTEIEVKFASTQTSQIYENTERVGCCCTAQERTRTPSESAVRNSKQSKASEILKRHPKSKFQEINPRAGGTQESNDYRVMGSSLLKVDSAILRMIMETKSHKRTNDSASTLTECECTKKETQDNLKKKSKRSNVIEEEQLLKQKRFQNSNDAKLEDTTSSVPQTKRGKRIEDSTSTECGCTRRETRKPMMEQSKRSSVMGEYRSLKQERLPNRKDTKIQDTTSTELSRIEMKPRQRKIIQKEEERELKNSTQESADNDEHRMSRAKQQANKLQNFENSATQERKCLCKKLIADYGKFVASQDGRRYTLINRYSEQSYETDNSKGTLCACVSENSYFSQTTDDGKYKRKNNETQKDSQQKYIRNKSREMVSEETSYLSESLISQITLESTTESTPTKQPDKQNSSPVSRKLIAKCECEYDENATKKTRRQEQQISDREYQRSPQQGKLLRKVASILKMRTQENANKFRSSNKVLNQMQSTESSLVLQPAPKAKTRSDKNFDSTEYFK